VVKQKEKSKNQLSHLLLFLPFAVIFTVFKIIPILSATVLSFTDFNLVNIRHFVGFGNYYRILFADDIFILSLKNTLILALITGPLGFILSFIVAWLINELGRTARSIATLVVYSPALVGNIYFIWQYIFSADSRGFLNDALIKLGLLNDPIAWLTDAKYNFAVVTVVTVWLSFGTGFLSFVAGLKALNRSYYEAAAIDGLKNRWQELYYVTFPQMGPQLLFGAVMSISGAFAVGAVNSNLTGFPSADYATHTLLLHLTDYANNRYEMGYASAVAVILFALMVLSWLLVNKALKKFNAK
jgi:multiple sugar transport system permease protein